MVVVGTLSGVPVTVREVYISCRFSTFISDGARAPESVPAKSFSHYDINIGGTAALSGISLNFHLHNSRIFFNFALWKADYAAFPIIYRIAVVGASLRKSGASRVRRFA